MPVRLAQNSWSVVGTRLPFTSIVRSWRSPSWSCGKAAEAAGGQRSTSPVVEELGPLPAQAVARLVGGQPVSMAHDVRSHHPGKVAVVIGRQGAGGSEVLLELRRRLAPGGRRPEELDVDPMRLARVDIGPRPVAH